MAGTKSEHIYKTKISFPRQGDTVVLKSIPVNAAQTEARKFENEALFAGESVDGLRKVLEFNQTGTHLVLKLDYIKGETAREYMAGLRTTNEKLRFCIKVCARLAEIHRRQVLHLNLNPDHILIDTEGTVHFISLGLATYAERKQIAKQKMLHTEADPDFIAPEQTGRIQAGIDYSSDLYSLGVVFYQLFTAGLPFADKTGLAKIHAHIAILPREPSRISDTPAIVSDFIMKLLQKDLSKRYHSANGALHDLHKMLADLESEKGLQSFVLGQNDSSGTIRFTNQLFGRERQLKKLNEAFQEASSGHKKLLLVYGNSGTGKSALVEQLYRSTLNEGGVYLSGKFDPLKTDVPYFAFSQVLGELMEVIQLSNQSELQTWKERLHEALHPIGRALFDVAPGMNLLLDNEPELPEINGFEAQLRFNFAMTNFLRVVSDLCKPLVIFMDDLQWCDPFSLSLIRNILTNDELKELLLIGAYRDNEVTVGHIFLQFKMDMEDLGVAIDEIELENLSGENVRDFVNTTLGHSENSLDGFADIVLKKSQGNALFVNQFVRSVYNHGMLRFNALNRSWEWDEEKILAFNVEGDIVNLLLQTINQLDGETISILKRASCIGNKFSLELLGKTTGQPVEQIYKALKQAINRGLIIESREHILYFVHDRVQQAIYSLTDDEEKGSFHLEIGRLLLENTAEIQLRDSIYEIVNQFNFARDLIEEDEERMRCCELNALAGNRSQEATAYVAALQYYETALEFVSDRDWKERYEFTFNVHWQAAVAAMQCNRPERFTQLTTLLDQKARPGLDKIKVAHIKIQHVIAESNHKEVLRIGLEILSSAGVHIKAKPSQIDVLLGFIRTNMRLGKFSEERIADLPRIDDEKLLTTMAIMHHVSLAAYWIEPNMVPIIMFKLIEFTLKHGIGPKTSFAFVVFGYINIAYMNRMEKGLKMGQLGKRLSDKLQYEDQICSLKQVYNTFISHWLQPLRDCIPDLEDGFRKGLEIGDFEFSSITAQLIIYWQFYSGEPLEKVLKRGELLNLQIAPLNQIIHDYRIMLFRESALQLVEGVNDFKVLKGRIFNEDEVRFPEIPAFDIYRHNLNAQKKLLAIFFNQDELAWEFCRHEKNFLIPVKGSPTEMLFYYYEALCIASIYHSTDLKGQKRLLGIYKKNLKLIKGLTKYSEQVYRPKYELMYAEFARITGKHEQTMLAYSNAIRYTRIEHLFHDEALAWERAGCYFKDLGQDDVARFYLSNAWRAYGRWGARAKQEQMLVRYEGYVTVDLRDSRKSNLDLDTVLKTINLISAELNLKNLLNGLMNLVVENAGADKACLIVKEDNGLIVRAAVNKSRNEIQVELNEPYDAYQDVSHTVVNHVIRHKEVLVLDDASQERPYSNEQYIQDNDVQSVVCVPLFHGDQIIAYLYIENSLVRGAFTAERIEILQVMARQTAISLQNTMLFEQTSRLNTELQEHKQQLEEYNLNLEKIVADRTEDLQKEKAKSDNLLLNILPADIARELKEHGKAAAKTYESVSVLFTDFKDFSKIAENMGAAELVDEIDQRFRFFDEIVHSHDIEKIKTIGDSYMAVSGLPMENEAHAKNAVLAALEMRDYILGLHNDGLKNDKPIFEVRIGIHSGNVVAGIVGSKKFAYDIWGDTVNIASRMESHGEVGKVNISQSTYELLKNDPDFVFEYRGKVEAKGKGQMDMYFVGRAGE